VLDSLASTSSAPGPIPISEQYAKAFKSVHGDSADNEDDDDPDGLAVQPSAQPRTTGFRFNLTKKKVLCKVLKLPSRTMESESKPDESKKVSKMRQPKGAEKNPHHIYGDYVPQNFLERSKLFREEAKAQGHSASEARAMWKNSRERAELLSMMPLPELKRRRFVAKGCQVHPFQMVVAELLRVDAPGILTLAVLLLIFNDKIPKTKDREFLEIFAGKGELSAAFRRAARQICSVCLRGASVDWDYDREVWNGSFWMGHFNGPTPKRHRQYTKEFGEFLASLFLKLMQAEMPRIITYLNSKHLKPPGLWDTWHAEMKTAWGKLLPYSLSMAPKDRALQKIGLL
ncbi:unnamed protein product, partial [Symbiodinium sp. CCMP2456]